jgi:hypothetical protein
MLGDAYVDLAMFWKASSDTVSFRSRVPLHVFLAALTLASFFAAVGWRAVVGHWSGSEVMFYGFLLGISRVLQMFGVEIVFSLLRYAIFYHFASTNSIGV